MRVDMRNFEKFALLGGHVVALCALSLVPLLHSSLKVDRSTDFDHTKVSLVPEDVYKTVLRVSVCQ